MANWSLHHNENVLFFFLVLHLALKYTLFGVNTVTPASSQFFPFHQLYWGSNHDHHNTNQFHHPYKFPSANLESIYCPSILFPGNNRCASVTIVFLFLIFYSNGINIVCSFSVSYCLVKHDAFEIHPYCYRDHSSSFLSISE